MLKVLDIHPVGKFSYSIQTEYVMKTNRHSGILQVHLITKHMIQSKLNRLLMDNNSALISETEQTKNETILNTSALNTMNENVLFL